MITNYIIAIDPGAKGFISILGTKDTEILVINCL